MRAIICEIDDEQVRGGIDEQMVMNWLTACGHSTVERPSNWWKWSCHDGRWKFQEGWPEYHGWVVTGRTVPCDRLVWRFSIINNEDGREPRKSYVRGLWALHCAIEGME